MMNIIVSSVRRCVSLGRRRRGYQEMNGAEKQVKADLESMGFKVFHDGFPDFLVSKDSNVFWVEVKSNMNKKDIVRPRQEEVHKILDDAGFPVVVVHQDWVDPKIIEILKKNQTKYLTTIQVANETNYGDDRARQLLDALTEKGYLKINTEHRPHRYYVVHIPNSVSQDVIGG